MINDQMHVVHARAAGLNVHQMQVTLSLELRLDAIGSFADGLSEGAQIEISNALQIARIQTSQPFCKLGPIAISSWAACTGDNPS